MAAPKTDSSTTSKGLTDSGLMEQYVHIQDQLYGYIVSILPDWADADEVFQETSLIL